MISQMKTANSAHMTSETRPFRLFPNFREGHGDEAILKLAITLFTKVSVAKTGTMWNLCLYPFLCVITICS